MMPSPPMEVFTKTSSVADGSSGIPNDCPILCADEATCDRELGSGGFCTVLAIRKLVLTPDIPSGSTFLLTNDEVVSRRRFAKKFVSYEKAYFSYRRIPGQPPPFGDPAEQKPPRIALKRLRSGLPRARHETGLSDLTSEVKMLGLLGNNHPHIISLHAVGVDNTSKNISFAVIDQLRCTLKNKLHMWREARGLGILIKRQTLRDLWLERMVILMQVASAIEYLHSKNMIHRDINCENIGFDWDDCVKIYDFGLARIVGNGGKLVVEKDAEKDNTVDRDIGTSHLPVYEMSTNTGTLKFMAPEIFLGLPYGFNVDVYSMAIVVYMVLSLFQPFAKIQPTLFESVVIKGGYRPPIEDWPDDLRELLSRMWSSDSARRPSSQEVLSVISDLLRGSDEKLFPKPYANRLFSM